MQYPIRERKKTSARDVRDSTARRQGLTCHPMRMRCSTRKAQGHTSVRRLLRYHGLMCRSLVGSCGLRTVIGPARLGAFSLFFFLRNGTIRLDNCRLAPSQSV